MSTVKIGDYVLATKYIDGDPCDQWCIGFVSEHWPSKKRWLVRDSEGNSFRHNGFRRAETITAEAGAEILRLMQAGAKPDSMWRLRDAVEADIDTTAKGGCVMGAIDDVLTERARLDDLHKDAMDLHRRYCDRQDRPHECVGQATIKRGEVCLDCPLCGQGEHHPWKPQFVQHAEGVLAAAGVQFHSLNRESQSAVLNTLEAVIQATIVKGN